MLAIALSFPLCLVIFGVNDVYDHDTDMKNPRKGRVWADGTILDKADHEYILFASKVSIIGVLLVALPALIQSPQVSNYLTLCLTISWAYSSPPLRLKERPLIDSVFTGLIYWSIWVCGYIVSNNSTYDGSETSSPGGWVLFSAIGLQSLGTILDIKPDAAANVRTIATVYGGKFTALFTMGCL
ncbi:hypothetical protein FQN49_003494 [Arthroderma sp. PD_2]|nr:hypothetical protein FQN49_003494 [Arthroderma sp. PD_2]